jgi:hypothetical protein
VTVSLSWSSFCISFKAVDFVHQSPDISSHPGHWDVRGVPFHGTKRASQRPCQSFPAPYNPSTATPPPPRWTLGSHTTNRKSPREGQGVPPLSPCSLGQKGTLRAYGVDHSPLPSPPPQFSLGEASWGSRLPGQPGVPQSPSTSPPDPGHLHRCGRRPQLALQGHPCPKAHFAVA